MSGRLYGKSGVSFLLQETRFMEKWVINLQQNLKEDGHIDFSVTQKSGKVELTHLINEGKGSKNISYSVIVPIEWKKEKRKKIQNAVRDIHDLMAEKKLSLRDAFEIYKKQEDVKVARETVMKDLEKLALSHKIIFKDSLISKLGVGVIKKTLEWFLLNDRGILFHIENESGDVLGYFSGIITTESGVFGSVSNTISYSFKEILFAYLSAPWLLLNKETKKKAYYFLKQKIKRVYMKLFLKGKDIKQKEFIPSVGLVSIGVLYSNKGHGTLLIKNFERLAKKSLLAIEENKIMTLTVKLNNLKAANFYLKNGWLENSRDQYSINFIKPL